MTWYGNWFKGASDPQYIERVSAQFDNLEDHKDCEGDFVEALAESLEAFICYE